MKYISSLLFFITFLLLTESEVISQKKSKSENKEISQLEETTTVFFFKNSRSPKTELIKQAVSSVWKITPLIFADVDSAANYMADSKYSYFLIKGYTKDSRDGVGGLEYSNTHFYLSLDLYESVSRKGSVKTKELARIELSPNQHILNMETEKRVKTPIEEKMYREGAFCNMSPVLIKAQLANLSTNLLTNNMSWRFNKIEADNLSTILAKDILFVPSSCLPDYGLFSGREVNKDEYFSEYQFKYKICSDDELYQIFEVEKRGKLLFEYVQSSTDKFITIYNLGENNIAYKKYHPLKYQLKAKDLRDID